MSQTEPVVPGPGALRSRLLLAAVGLLAVTAGIVLPQAWLVQPHSSAPPTVAEPAPQSSLAYTPPAWPEAPDPRAMLLRLAWGTIVVLALCMGTLWIGKKWIRGAPLPSTPGGQLRVLESVLLGSRCSVYLLQAGQRQVLVGIDGSGLKALVPLPEPFEATLAEMQTTDLPPADAEPPAAGQLPRRAA